MQIVEARRVVSTDRTGSSWPVLVETSDGLRFTKLRGAGQGTGALVAEIIVGALADALGLNVPARSLVRIPRDIESVDRNDELRWLLDASDGINLGFAFLDGARNLDAAQVDTVNRDDAAAIVWLDGLVMNPDRTHRNPNLMWWRDRLWLIDHGAALGFQYAWSSVSELSTGLPMPTHEPHLLRDRVADLHEWDEIFAARLTRDVIDDAVAQVPDDFLAPLMPAAEPPMQPRSCGAARRTARSSGSDSRRRARGSAWKHRRPNAGAGARPAPSPHRPAFQ